MDLVDQRELMRRCADLLLQQGSLTPYSTVAVVGPFKITRFVDENVIVLERRASRHLIITGPWVDTDRKARSEFIMEHSDDAREALELFRNYMVLDDMAQI